MANTYTQIYIHIVKQQQNPRRKSFREEYVELLKRYNVPRDQRYIFPPVDSD
jgi:hypothetical protein